MGDGIEDIWLYTNGSSAKAVKCLPGCEIQTNTFSLSSTPFPAEAAFPFMQGFCFVLKKVLRICSSNNKHRIALFVAKYPKLTCGDVINNDTFNQMCDANFQPISQRVNDPIYESLLDYARANVAQVKVFIQDPFYTKIKRDEEITIWTFVANAGGLLGLYLGLSMISIFEMVYFIGICLCKLMSGHQTRSAHVDE